ncbi:MAG: ABC transporter ATP-binding protein [Dehalococcoidia bacterium]
MTEATSSVSSFSSENDVTQSGGDTERGTSSVMLRVEELRKIFPGRGDAAEVAAVDGISFEVQRGDLFTLLGPSGCGKTTTLRCIAGLEHASSGRIEVDDWTLFSSQEQINVPANQRGLGMVFQSYAIWPHMDVRQNVAYPLTVLPRRERPSRREVSERVDKVLSVVQLEQLGERRATDLSGGQQQRLALARALVMEPPLLLLDEPLSNLDAKLREGMRLELKRLQQELGITAVYVTHDQVEALAISNVIAVMDHGVVQQIGSPREIYERPANRFVADFIGTANFLEGTVREAVDDVAVVETGCGIVRAVIRYGDPVASGAKVSVSLRPEHVTVSEELVEPAPNRWRGRVVARAFLGEAVDHVIDVDGQQIRARGDARISIQPGSQVSVTLEPGACHVLPRG